MFLPVQASCHGTIRTPSVTYPELAFMLGNAGLRLISKRCSSSAKVPINHISLFVIARTWHSHMIAAILIVMSSRAMNNAAGQLGWLLLQIIWDNTQEIDHMTSLAEVFQHS